ncbi:MAG TPA: dihydrofolate reductase family protein [Rhizomicrobium sp.]|jgi:dihydrofolate reductase|nr:dihydrofolate reductase family protein [Rhizomicrobium sp.]
MRKLIMTMFVTLDGVMQAPGGPDEDKEGGFSKGGWQAQFSSDDFGPIMMDWFDRAGGFVLGRKTYDIFASYWPKIGEDNPIAKGFNTRPKYVASTTLKSADWAGTTLIAHDVPRAIQKLKDEPGGDLLMFGSGALARSFLQHRLIDLCRLWVYPAVLGEGKRLFTEGLPYALRLTESKTLSSGAVVNTYEPGDKLVFKSIGDA